MNVRHVLLVCFLTALHDGNTELASAETLVRAEGSTIIVACHFSLFGRKKFLCKDECKKEDVLIETEGDRAQSGRYGIAYKEGTFLVSDSVLYVSITRLIKSDSGRYRCGLERAYLPDSHWEFDIRVTDAPKTEQQQTEETTAAVQSVKVSRPGHVLPLIVCVTVAVLFSFVVLLFCKRRTGRDSDGLNTRGQSDGRNMETVTYEKCSPLPECEDYTSLTEDRTGNNQDSNV